MRAPNVRVVLAGLAAAAVFVGGSIATRNGPLGGGTDGGGGLGQATSAVQGAAAPTTSLAGLGSLADRLARLPAVAPGELAGVLYIAGCPPTVLDLATLETRTAPTEKVCAALGARFGIRFSELQAAGPFRAIPVVDLNGKPVETVHAPDGWDFFGLARQGLVFCRDADPPEGRLRRFRGRTTRLPSCPLGQTRAGLMLYPGGDGRSVIDERGRQVAAVAGPVQAGVTAVSEFGDGLLLVDHDLYRDGHRIASFPEEHLVRAASRDGTVALLLGADERTRVYHHGQLHTIDDELVRGGPGLVAPDGRRILLQPDSTTMIEIDAATRRPLARLDTPELAFDWRSAVVRP
jgi:hypothetical protein